MTKRKGHSKRTWRLHQATISAY